MIGQGLRAEHSSPRQTGVPCVPWRCLPRLGCASENLCFWPDIVTKTATASNLPPFCSYIISVRSEGSKTGGL